MPPRALASGPKPYGAKKSLIIVSDVGSFVYGVKSSQVITLKWRAMFRLLERAAFCIFSSTCLLLEPVRVRIVLSRS